MGPGGEGRKNVYKALAKAVNIAYSGVTFHFRPLPGSPGRVPFWEPRISKGNGTPG